MDFFSGEFDQTVEKGRLTVPRPIVRLIERGDPKRPEGERPAVRVVYGAASWNRLECYTLRTYERLIKRLARLPGTDPNRAPALTIYGTYSFETQVDEMGRLTIPQKYREKLGLEGKVCVSGKLDHFRIWRREEFEATDGAQAEAWAPAQDPAFEIASILPDDSYDDGDD